MCKRGFYKVKKIVLLLMLILISCGEKKEDKTNIKANQNIQLNELKKQKQKEVDSLNLLVKKLQAKRDSLKKVSSK